MDNLSNRDLDRFANEYRNILDWKDIFRRLKLLGFENTVEAFSEALNQRELKKALAELTHRYMSAKRDWEITDADEPEGYPAYYTIYEDQLEKLEEDFHELLGEWE